MRNALENRHGDVLNDDYLLRDTDEEEETEDESVDEETDDETQEEDDDLIETEEE